MNNKRFTNWGVYLGSIEVIVILSIVFLTLISSFIFGYKSGSKSGYEEAKVELDSFKLTFPLTNNQEDEELDHQQISDVYARLKKFEPLEEETTEESLPTLGLIKSTKDSPIDIEVKEEDPKIIEDKKEVEKAIEEKVVKAKEIEKPKKPTEKIKSGWYVQYSSESDISQAKGLKAKMRNLGFPALTQYVNTGSKVFYRVLLGPESKSIYAQRMLDQLKKEFDIKTKPFVRRF